MDKKTCLHDKHVALSAHMVPFGGFDMPLYYESIIAEHEAVRNHVGVFDVSHMGEVRVTGTDAEAFVQYIFTNDVAGSPSGQIYYGMMLHENGGTIDDLLVYKMAEQDFLLVINAANIEKDYAHIVEQAKSFNVKIKNLSDVYGQIAIQGPDSETTLENILGIPCKELTFYTFKTIEEPNETIIVSRTGYTGEDGFEIYGSHSFIQNIWEKLMDAKIQPCGLGCRDTLRFEVGLPLYGDELTDEISPIMCGLSMFVKLDKNSFIGKKACVDQKENKTYTHRIVGVELQEKGIPRHGYSVLADGKEIGYVTTGYKSISTGKFLCMAYINKEFAKLGTSVEVMIHNKPRKGIVVKKRFYQKNYKK